MPLNSADIEELVEQWRRDGCLVLRNVLDLERVARLRSICDAARDQWHARATADSEPGGFAPGPQEWILLHLNHPQYHRDGDSLPVLLDAVADPLILDLVNAIMAGHAVFAQANYYIEPVSESRGSQWHRDCQFFDSDDDVVRAAISAEAEPPRELHVHIPLAPTTNTHVVRGSHNRWDTDEEYRVRTETPTADSMPGAEEIALTPGDLALFHVNAIHRGVYPQEVTRRTIAITYGSARHPRLPTREMMKDWGGYVCTYQPWFLAESYLDGIAPRTRTFFERFIEAYGDTWQSAFLDPDWHPTRLAYFTPPFA